MDKQTKDLTPAPVIEWRVVKPIHYRDAHRLKADRGTEVYEDYVIALVFHLDGEPVRQRPPQKVARQIVAEFEAEFKPKETGKDGG